ncbi:MAG TPA: serine/threonine-protein kinase, partial [Gemmata sp.]|nr:serine/threonine-protein kinase [Gemmata sp.]
MNEPHAPNVTSDIPSVPANSLSAGDSPSTIDHDPATGSTDGSTGEAASASDLPSVPGYQVVSEIARGGMGRVLAAFDLTLDRDVALKVLLPGARPDRFIRESKIAARLPHPGIPPIHALGSLADGSPFLAMKLIVGQTLSDEMKTADRPMLLQAFAQVCQAVGFAHSRGIIHRDLKPANVMVGAFGEVQVMDWGLAKDLTSRDFASEPRSSETPTSGTDPNQTTDIRDPSESTDGRTQAGQVMGTPAYMPPEQARGEVTDARTDVFALGGILCRILTGKPPFSGKSSLEVIQRAAAGDLVEANVRLDGCGADAELVALCRDCLSPNPTDRPANGQAVTDRMTAYLNGVQERLQAVERERAVASARAIEERRRRKVQLIAASLVLFVLLAGIAGTTVGLLNAREQRNLADSRNEQLIVANANTENEKTRAEQNFSRARDLIMTLGTQINQIETGQKNPKIADLTRKQALDEARGQFEQFRAGLPDDVTVQLQAAALHRYSGNLSRLMYDYKAAKDAYASSIKILEDLTTRFPQSYEYRYTFAQTLGERALVEMSTGKLNDSAATWDRALKIAENPQPAAFEANYGRVVGLNEYNRAKIAHLMGRFQDAIRSAGRSKELLDQLKTVPFKEQQSIDPLLAVMPVNHL